MTFPNPPAGFAIDPNSIIGAASPPFSLGALAGAGTAGQTIALVPGLAPTQIGNGNVFRYAVTESFTPSGSQTVTVNFHNNAWSFIDLNATAASQSLTTVNPNGVVYVDVTFAPAFGQTIQSSSITNAAITLTEAGATLAADTQSPMLLSGTTYRFFFDGQFVPGLVNVGIVASGWQDLDGVQGLASTAAFTVEGPTAVVSNPANGGTADITNVNQHKTIDVTFGPAVGGEFDPTSIVVGDITLSGPGSNGATLSSPTLVSGTTYRFTLNGSFVAGAVQVNFAAGAWKDYGFIDIEIVVPAGASLVASSVTSASVTLAGVPNAQLVADSIPVLLGASGNTTIYRFFTTGSFGGAIPTVNVPADGYSYVDSCGTTQQAIAGAAVVVDASDPIGNQAATGTFTVAPFSATLAAIGPASVVTSDSLNNRGYLDVPITIPAYAVAIDPASIATLTPKFTVTVNNPSDGTLTLDTTQAPVLIGVVNGVATYRFWYTGTYHGGPGNLTIHPLGGSFNFLDAAGKPIPDFADESIVVGQSGPNLYVDVPFGTSGSLDGASITKNVITITGATIASVSQVGPAGTYRFIISGSGLASGQQVTVHFVAGSWTYADASNGSVQNPSVATSPSASTTGGTYIDVTYPTLNGVAIDPSTITGHEFTLTGAGAQGVGVAGAPLLIAQSASSSTYRYFLTGAFAAGPVDVQFTGTWSDKAGDLGTPGDEPFLVTAPLEPPPGLQSQSPAFFIAVTGGLELDDPTGQITQPLLLITGGATLTIADGPVFTLDASGSVSVFHIGTIASGAAHFTLDVSAGFSAVPKLWGVLKLETDFGFLKQYGITATGSALLQINTTSQTQDATISLPGIPGDPIVATVPLANGKTVAGLVAELPGTATADIGVLANLSADWIALFNANGIAFAQGTTPEVESGFDPSGNSVWEVIDVAGDYQYFIRDVPAVTGGAAEHLEIDGDPQTFHIAPQSFLVEILGNLTVANPDGSGSTWFTIRGGVEISISNAGFQFFALARLDLTGASLAKVALIAVNPLLATVNTVDITAVFAVTTAGQIPGVAGELKVQFSLGTGTDQYGLGGIPSVNFTGSFLLIFNSTGSIFRYDIPSEFVALLDPTDPTSIVVPASAPTGNNLFTDATQADANTLPTALFAPVAVPSDWVGRFSTLGGVTLGSGAKVQATVLDAAGAVIQWSVDDGGASYTIATVFNIDGTFKEYQVQTVNQAGTSVYLQLQIQGALNLFNEITLVGSFTITVSATLPGSNGGPATVMLNVQGSVSLNVQFLGELSGAVNFTAETGGTNAFWGSAQLSRASNGSIPGVGLSGHILLAVNASSTNQAVDKFTFDPTTHQLVIVNGLPQTHSVQFPPGLLFQIGGSLSIGGTTPASSVLSISGEFDLTINGQGFSVNVNAQASLAGLGNVSISGSMSITAAGLVTDFTASLDASFGGGVGLSFSVTGVFDLNTGSTATNAPDGTLVQPGFLLTLTGSVSFASLATANGTITVAIQHNSFTLGFNVLFSLGGGLNVRAVGFAGIYNDGHPGIAIELGVSVKLTVAQVITIDASGSLLLNTSGVPRTTLAGTTIGASSFGLSLNGKVSILGVFNFNTSFMVQIGGNQNVAVGSGSTAQTIFVAAGQWVVSFSAGINFFGLATLSAYGWFESDGQFDIALTGGITLGTHDFGLSGTFNVGASYLKDSDGGGYTFSINASASVDARLFGISLASLGISFNFSFDNRSNGSGTTTVDVDVSITVRIHILFVTISKTANFDIGTVEIPQPFYLAGDQANGQSWTQSNNGTLYLNMGSRSSYRNLANNSPNESFTIAHVSGNAASGETVQVTAFGQQQTFAGVKKIVGIGSTNSTSVIVQPGVTVPVELTGGAGTGVNNTLIYGGTGFAYLNGGGGDSFIEVGPTTAGAVVNGGSGNAYIVDQSSARTFLAGGGPNDQIFAGSGNDTILGDGSFGTDGLTYTGPGWTWNPNAVTSNANLAGTGNSEIKLGSGVDTVKVGNGNNSIEWPLQATSGTTVTAGTGSNTLIVDDTPNTDYVAVAHNGGNLGVATTTSTGTVLGSITATGITSLMLVGGAGSDNFTFGDLDGSGLTQVSIDAGQNIVATGATQNVPDSADPTQIDKIPVVIVSPKSSPDTIDIRGADDGATFLVLASSPVDGVMSSVSVLYDNGAGHLVTDFSITHTVRSRGDTLTIDGLGRGDTINASGLGAPPGTPASDYPDMIALVENGGPGNVTLIASPYNDVLNVNDTDTNVVNTDTYIGGLGTYDLQHHGNPNDINIFEETQNLDFGLFNDQLVIGQLLQDGTNLPFATGEVYAPESAIIDAVSNTTNPNLHPASRGSRFAAGAIVEPLKGLFQEVILTDASGQDVMLVNAPSNTITIGGVSDTVAPWQGSAVLRNTNTSNAGAGVQHYIVNIPPANSGRVQVINTVSVVGMLVVYGTDQPDNLVLNASGSGTFRVGTVVDSGVSNTSVSFSGLARTIVETGGGNDQVLVNDTASPTIVDLGTGNDSLTVGTVPTIPDTGNRTLAFPNGVPVVDTADMTNGNSNDLFGVGGGGDNTFTVNHNAAMLYLNGGSGDNLFIVKTFLVLRQNSANPSQITNLTTLFGGPGNNRYEYLQNAPVVINGGSGYNTLVIVGMPLGDTFIVGSNYVAGAGRLVNFKNIQAIEIAGDGPAQVYVMSTSPGMSVTVAGGATGSTVSVGGNPPPLVFTPPPYTYTPPPIVVPLPPVLVETPYTLNEDGYTFTVPFSDFLFGGIAADATALANSLATNYAASLGLLGATIQVGQTTIAGVSTQLVYSLSSLFQGIAPQVQVTIGTFRVNFQVGQLEPQSKLVQPAPVTVTPAPFVFDVPPSLDVSQIKGRLIVENANVIVHDENGPATNGILQYRTLDRLAKVGEVQNGGAGTKPIYGLVAGQSDTFLSLEGFGLGISPAGQPVFPAGSVQYTPAVLQANGGMPPSYYGLEITGSSSLQILLPDNAGSLNKPENFTIAQVPSTLSLTLDPGDGNATINVAAVGAHTTIYGGQGQDRINVGGAGRLDQILGGLTIDGTRQQSEIQSPVLGSSFSPTILNNLPTVFIDTDPAHFTTHVSPSGVVYSEPVTTPIVGPIPPGNLSGPLQVFSVVLDANGAIIQDNVHEYGSQEYALQQTGAGGALLWYDSQGNPTTDSTITGVPVIQVVSKTTPGALPVYLDAASNQVLTNTGTPAFVADFVNGVPLYLTAGGVQTTANTGNPALIQVDRSQPIPWTTLQPVMVAATGSTTLFIDDSRDPNATIGTLKTTQLAVDQLLLSGSLGVTQAAGQTIIGQSTNRTGADAPQAKTYFGGEPVVDPYTLRPLTYTGGQPVLDLFTGQPLFDPFGNLLRHRPGDPMLHLKGDPVVQLVGAPQLFLGGEVVRDENGNPVTNATHLTGNPALTFAEVNGVGTVARGAGSWFADGFAGGDKILVSGTGQNDGMYTVASINTSGTTLTLNLADPLTKTQVVGQGPISGVTVQTLFTDVGGQVAIQNRRQTTYVLVSGQGALVPIGTPFNPPTFLAPTSRVLALRSLPGFTFDLTATDLVAVTVYRGTAIANLPANQFTVDLASDTITLAAGVSLVGIDRVEVSIVAPAVHEAGDPVLYYGDEPIMVGQPVVNGSGQLVLDQNGNVVLYTDQTIGTNATQTFTFGTGATGTFTLNRAATAFVEVTLNGISLGSGEFSVAGDMVTVTPSTTPAPAGSPIVISYDINDQATTETFTYNGSAVGQTFRLMATPQPYVTATLAGVALSLSEFTVSGTTVTVTLPTSTNQGEQLVVTYRESVNTHARGEPVFVLSTTTWVTPGYLAGDPVLSLGNAPVTYFGGEPAYYTNADIVQGSEGFHQIAIDGGMPGSILFRGIQAVVVSTGSGADTFTIVQTGLDPAFSPIGTDAINFTLNTGAGVNQVAVRSVSGPTTIRLGAGDATVDVGSEAGLWATNPQAGTLSFISVNGNLTGIGAPLNVVGGTGKDTLNVDDNGDTVGRTGTLDAPTLTTTTTTTSSTTDNGGVTTYTVVTTSPTQTTTTTTTTDDAIGISTSTTITTSTGVAPTSLGSGLLSGLGMVGTIDYATIATFGLALGTGNDTFTINNTGTGSTGVEGWGGDDTINIRATSGPTTIVGHSLLNIHPFGPLNALDLVGNPFVNSVATASGDDTINVGSNAGQNASNTGGVLDGILSGLTIDGLGRVHGDLLHIDDSGDSSAATGTLTSTTLTGFGMAAAGITYDDVEGLLLGLGLGANQLLIASTDGNTTAVNAGPSTNRINIRSIGGPLAINGGSGTNAVNVGTAFGPTSTYNGSPLGGALDQINSPLRINGGSPTSTVTLDDSGAPVNSVGVLTGSSLDGLDFHTNPVLSVAIAHASGGTFILRIGANGPMTPALPYAISSEDLRSAILGLGLPDVTDVEVVRSGDTFTVGFIGDYLLPTHDLTLRAVASGLVTDSSGLTPAVTVAGATLDVVQTVAVNATAGSYPVSVGSIPTPVLLTPGEDPVAFRNALIAAINASAQAPAGGAVNANDIQVVLVGKTYVVTYQGLLRGTAGAAFLLTVAPGSTVVPQGPNAVQVGINAVGGTFTLSPAPGMQTYNLPWNATASAVAAALNGLLGGNGIAVTMAGSVYTITGLPSGSAATFSIDDSTLVNPVVSSGRTQGVRYENVGTLNVLLPMVDVVFNVRGTTAVTNVFGYSGNKQFFVSSTANENLQTAEGTQYLGGNLDGLLGNLNISAGAGRHKLFISDASSVSGVANGAITDMPTSPTRLPNTEIEVRGLSVGPIDYQAVASGNFADGITMWTGDGPQTITVNGTFNRNNATDANGNAIRNTTTLNTGLGNHTVTVNLTAGQDGFFVLNTQGPVTQYPGLAETNRIDASASTLPLIIFGGQGANTILGGQGGDIIFGSRGRVEYLNDQGQVVAVLGNGGQGDFTDGVVRTPSIIASVDTKVGGNDTITGGASNNIILGGPGANAITAGAANDIALGHNGVILLTRGQAVSITTLDPVTGGNTTITGGAGNDIILGGNGANTIVANGGNDVILGHNGQVLLANGKVTSIATTDPTVGGNDTITGGPGFDMILGGAGANAITGGTGNDIILGGNGLILLTNGLPSTITTTDPTVAFNDTIVGSTGDDILLGGPGSNSIRGLSGNDIILGNDGLVLLMAGKVTSIATSDPGVGLGNVITDGNGNDIILGAQGPNTIAAGNGRDIILGGFGSVTYAGPLLASVASDPTIVGKDNTITAGDGNDIVLGGIGNNRITVGNGIDVVIGHLGVVTLLNGTYASFATIAPTVGGNDTIAGGNGPEVILGGVGRDTITVGDGNDIVIGSNGQVLLTAGQVTSVSTTNPGVGGNDTITAGDGSDIILGGDGSNTIVAGKGNDAILGGLGLVLLAPPTNPPGGVFGIGKTGWAFTSITSTDAGVGGGNTITTGNGNSVVLGGPGANRIVGGSGSNVLIGHAGSVLYANGHLAEIDAIEPTIGGPTTIAAGAGNDVILGGAGQNTITATTGNEIIVAGNGQVLYSGSLMTGVATTFPSTGGNDTINGGNGNDIILGGDGTDQITVGSGNNFILAHDGQVALSQGQVTSIATTNPSFGGNDTIVSGSGNDVILAGPGNTSIAGGTGNDIIIGGDGQVLFSQGQATLIATTDATGGNDVIAAGTGKDIVIAGAGTDRIAGGNGNGIILGGLGTITLVAGSATLITSTITTLGGNDVIVSGTGNDVVIGGHGNDTIVDMGGNNVLIAGLGKVAMSLGQVTSAATIASAGGNTSITGGNGNDIMLGGSGNDTLTGGRGNEVILGGNGQVVANSGSNVFAQAVLTSASPTLGGNDTITGGAGNNVLVGGSGTDQIYGGGGNDVIFGSNARITLPAVSAASLASINTTATVPAGVHIIHAGKGKDVIYGGPGNNQIFGGSGASYLNGGTTVAGASSGYDVIQGGTGVSTLDMGFPAGVPASVRPAVNFQVSTDFSTGVPAPFTGRSGSWSPAAGKYQASSSSPAISTFTLNVAQASYVELQVTLSGSNTAGLVFNYQGANNYDFAELNPSTGRLTIGHVASGVVFTDAASTVSVPRGSTPTLALAIKGRGVTAYINGGSALNATYASSVTPGQLGLISATGSTAFANFLIRGNAPTLFTPTTGIGTTF